MSYLAPWLDGDLNPVSVQFQGEKLKLLELTELDDELELILDELMDDELTDDHSSQPISHDTPYGRSSSSTSSSKSRLASALKSAPLSIAFESVEARWKLSFALST